MKKTRRRIFGILMTALMVCLPAMQALAQSFDASVMDPVPILFPGDVLEGITTPVTLDGAPLDLGAEVPVSWTNEDENKVYRTDLAEDGSLVLTLAGYELDVEGGSSEAGDETTGPIGGHYVNADGTVDTVEGEPTKDRAYYPAGTVVRLKADEPKEGMVFDKWTVETLSGAVKVEEETNSETTVTMPEEKVKITASYRAADSEVPADGAPAEDGIDPNMGVTPEGQDGVDAGLAPEEQQIPGADLAPEVPDGADTGVAPDGTVVVDNAGTAPEEQPADPGMAPEAVVDPNGENTVGDSILSGVDENAIDIMIGDDYSDLGTVVSDTPEEVPAPEENNETRYMLSVNFGTVTLENAEGADASQGFTAGTPITVTANDYTANGCYFNGWVAGPGELALENNMEQTVTFEMPAGELVLTAQYIDANGISVADPTIPLPADDTPDPQDEEEQEGQQSGEPVIDPAANSPEPIEAGSYTLTVENGTITAGATETGVSSATIAAGTEVTVTANPPAAEQQFKEWSLKAATFTLTPETLAQTAITFTMPAEDVSLIANYGPIPAPPEPQTYTLTMENGTANGTAVLSAKAGEVLTLKAAAAAAGMQFSGWTVKETATGAAAADASFGSASAEETTFTMPAANVTVTAVYTAVEYTITVGNGSASAAKAAGGTTITLIANKAPKGMEFDYWQVGSGNASLANAYSASTTFTMPTANVTVSANYKLKEYYVTVENGYADDEYYNMDDDVTIYSNYPSSGREFDKWVVIDGKASFADSSRWKTTFTMPAKDVTVSATYKDGPSPEDNQILDLVAGGEYITDSTIKFTAAGAGMDNTNPNPGDYRYRPTGYQIGNVTGSWQAAPYTTSMSIKARGDYTLKVNYSKDVYDGSNWVADGTTDTRSVTFRVLTPAEAVKTGNDIPLVQMIALAGGSLLVLLLLVVVVLRRRKNR